MLTQLLQDATISDLQAEKETFECARGQVAALLQRARATINGELAPHSALTCESEVGDEFRTTRFPEAVLRSYGVTPYFPPVSIVEECHVFFECDEAVSDCDRTQTNRDLPLTQDGEGIDWSVEGIPMDFENKSSMPSDVGATGLETGGVVVKDSEICDACSETTESSELAELLGSD